MMIMTELSRSTTISAPVGAVFAFLLDPSRLVGAFPSRSASAHDERAGLAELGSTSQSRFTLCGLHQQAILEYSDVVTDDHVTITSSQGSACTASLTPLGQGTELTLTVK
jgi:hypothetical protein